MRPGQTQTGMSSYRPPDIFFMRLLETGLKMNSDPSDVISVAGPRREILTPACVGPGLM